VEKETEVARVMEEVLEALAVVGSSVAKKDSC
jgi:hypothetical protein